jgi:chemotaxis protein CheY-P-specific phosphatase CheC
VLERARLDKPHEKILEEIFLLGTYTGLHWLKSLAGDGVSGSVNPPTLYPSGVIPLLVTESTDEKLTLLEQIFDGEVCGRFGAVLSEGSGTALASYLLEKQDMPPELLTEIRDDVLCEAGNVTLNGFVATLADALGVDLNSKTPTMKDLPRHEWMSDQDGEVEIFSATASISSSDGALSLSMVFILEIIPTMNLSDLLDKSIPLPDKGPEPGG